ncbi:M13 family metallopeptidase [Niveibacterium terrae]|uniref:M13 family metallopeptidase n=1 Tax=Niveibacterium terrae TaxID=3373598 RepID=UPI003A8EE02D
MTKLAVATASTLLALFSATTPAVETPLEALPYTPGLDVSAMDRTADPCTDFYQYTCGGWQKNNPIPADQARWDVYRKLHSDSQRFQWGILDKLAKNPQSGTPDQRKLGDYFAACTDEERSEALGAQPLEAQLARVAALTAKRALPALLAELQRDVPDAKLFFGFGAAQDFADPNRVIASASAGGLSLPDRDAYLRRDARSATLRRQYVEHIARTFVLLGETPAQAKNSARQVLRIETALAGASLSKVEMRDPYKLYHGMDAKALAALTPHFDWKPFLAANGTQDTQAFNVTEPKFFKSLDSLLAREKLADIKTYLRWQLAHSLSPYLAKSFADENFSFFGRTLHGIQAQAPRWKRCVELTDRQLGEALGQEFVARAFSPELKAKTLKMTRQIEDAMAKDLAELDWMSPETKKKAQQKLAAIVNKIGYPDKWRDYSALIVTRDDFAGNVMRATRFESQRRLAKIGKPVEHGEWDMTPTTVNAYYDPQMNDINFPAGVLQAPLYDAKMDDAPNYGNTGGTIGHELTHAFDDEGRQFDAHGKLTDWWQKKDADAFNSRAQCIVDQYGKYVVVDDIRINSRLTLGEDIADLGGLILAWTAWKAETADQALESRDGLTPEQRFFVGYAQWACENNRPEDMRVHARTDPHSPGKYRVNGLVVNMPEFAKAFACKPGKAMTKTQRCRVW